MLIIRIKGGVEVRIPVEEIETIQEVERASGVEKPIARHPYLHREGANRCAACWQDRLHSAHTSVAEGST